MSNTRRKKPVVNSTVTENVTPLIEVKELSQEDILQAKINTQGEHILNLHSKVKNLENIIDELKSVNKQLRISKENINRLNDLETSTLRNKLNKIPNLIRRFYGIKS
tara:strand:+ start:269 stop:589 length:321 start_codon:yes stop_codon:yes gene_type:complete